VLRTGNRRQSREGRTWVSRCAGVLAAAVLAGAAAAGPPVADFEDVALAPESFWNGEADPNAGGFASGAVWLSNHYNPAWSSWDGFACSNRTDRQTRWLPGQYTAITGCGWGGSANYAVGYCSAWAAAPKITLTGAPEGRTLAGAYLTNIAYTYWSMREGDAIAKKFGGASGHEPDWFLLTIAGIDKDGQPTGPVECYLADFRFADGNQDYIVDDWTWVDLTPLGDVVALEFSLSSSDNDPVWGMNTPAYFAMDTLLPAPSGLAVLALGAAAVLRRRRR
jgi:hypothetical protein